MDKKQKSRKTSKQEVWVKPTNNVERADLLVAEQQNESPMFSENLMEEICERNNLKQAMKRVIKNKGGPGADGMRVEKLKSYLVENWLSIKEELLSGKYKPKVIKRVEIRKHGGGKRKLSIPCVVDRFLQQAILQVLQSKWDSKFSEHSYGFRPRKSAHQAIRQAQVYIKSGNSFLVDIDLKQFFDEVNHNRLMSSLSKEINDKRVLKLIRGYLQAGILENGVITVAEKGASQGSPISPFLSNIVLDELDKELGKRGHCYVRFADDCNIYLKSYRAAQRVMKSITHFIEKKLKLKVNQQKSAIDTPDNRKFLGFSFTKYLKPHRIKIADESIKRFKDKIRRLTGRNSIKMETRISQLSSYITGWKGYFGICEAKSIFNELDSWIRRRLRSVIWVQWKTPRCKIKELLIKGVSEKLAVRIAWSTKGPWRLSHSKAVQMALNNNYFSRLGLPKLGK